MLDAHPEWASRLKVVTHDLVAPFSDRVLLEMGSIDYMVSMASESHVDRSIEDPETFCLNNYMLSINMLQAARKLQPHIYVNIGTDEVYGPADEGYKHIEWDTIIPSNPYAASKAAQEANSCAWYRTYDVPVVLTNSMNMIGELQHPEKLIPSIIRNVIAGKEQVIYGTEKSIGSRFYIHARNHADALLFILKRDPSRYSLGDTRPDRYNIVGEKEFNNLEIAWMVAEIIGKPLKYKLVDFHASRPGHDRRYALNGQKMARLGWKPPIDIEDTIRSTVEWYAERPEWLTVK